MNKQLHGCRTRVCGGGGGVVLGVGVVLGMGAGGSRDLRSYGRKFLSLHPPAQAVRIPNSVFTRSSCQVLYVGAPDWTAGSLTVEFVNGARTRRNPDGSVCTARSFFSYVDGAYQRPVGVSGLGVQAVDVPWGVFAVMDPKVAKKGLAAWRNGTNTTADDFNSPPPPAQRRQDGIPIKLER